MKSDTELTLLPDESTDENYLPGISLDHDGNNLFVIVGGEHCGTADSVSNETYDRLRKFWFGDRLRFTMALRRAVLALVQSVEQLDELVLRLEGGDDADQDAAEVIRLAYQERS